MDRCVSPSVAAHRPRPPPRQGARVIVQSRNEPYRSPSTDVRDAAAPRACRDQACDVGLHRHQLGEVVAIEPVGCACGRRYVNGSLRQHIDPSGEQLGVPSLCPTQRLCDVQPCCSSWQQGPHLV
ncbi:hypothetical protein DYB32_004432 [Aphanomyces invadans]|uniref:Uncharacterized protein n=1 Tax=Aphanomyces invadans TaxID=157072 RepID=A0A418AXK2_9STRA|nr:hypothetical protein DYB32_004432 [Aphanomyces invadans]